VSETILMQIGGQEVHVLVGH